MRSPRGSSLPAAVARTCHIAPGWCALRWRSIHLGVALAVAACLQGETSSRSLFADTTAASTARMLRGKICVGRLRGGDETPKARSAASAALAALTAQALLSQQNGTGRGGDPAAPTRNQRNSTVDSLSPPLPPSLSLSLSLSLSDTLSLSLAGG